MEAETVDIEFANQMGFAMIAPRSGRGLRWLRRNVCAEPWQWIGGSIAMEGRYLDETLEGAREHGLTCSPMGG